MGVKILNIMLLCNRDDIVHGMPDFATGSTFENCECVSVTFRCGDLYRSLIHNMERISHSHKSRIRRSNDYIERV
jgi:hypothetical protein